VENKCECTIRLSVLIPAYEYSAGVQRILDVIADCVEQNVEFIINDDSKTDEVEQVVSRHRASANVQYRRNDPPLGAIQNWNHLLQSAHGQFVMVLHHDECPIHPHFFDDLCAVLDDTIDALVLDCFIGNLSRGRMRRHFPLSLKAMVLRYCPSYLLRRNLLGGPSVMVVRRDRTLPFDIRIPMMVDVEWYCRLMRQSGYRVRVSSKLALLSVHYQGSITTSFGHAVPMMIHRQSALLRTENPSLRMLALSAPRATGERLLGVLESVGWFGLRAVNRLVAALLARRIPSHLLRSWK
jgi:hypothetical protein